MAGISCTKSLDNGLDAPEAGNARSQFSTRKAANMASVGQT